MACPVVMCGRPTPDRELRSCARCSICTHLIRVGYEFLHHEWNYGEAAANVPLLRPHPVAKSFGSRGIKRLNEGGSLL